MSIGHLDAPKGRIHVMPAFTKDDRERYIELEKLSAQMDMRYQSVKVVNEDSLSDEEIIAFRYVAARFLKGWGRAEILSGIVINSKRF